MTTSNDKKGSPLEQQFQELFERAKELYPNIEDTISLSNNVTAQTIEIRDYLNLTIQTPSETSSNQISF